MAKRISYTPRKKRLEIKQERAKVNKQLKQQADRLSKAKSVKDYEKRYREIPQKYQQYFQTPSAFKTNVEQQKQQLRQRDIQNAQDRYERAVKEYEANKFGPEARSYYEDVIQARTILRDVKSGSGFEQAYQREAFKERYEKQRKKALERMGKSLAPGGEYYVPGQGGMSFGPGMAPSDAFYTGPVGTTQLQQQQQQVQAFLERVESFEPTYGQGTISGVEPKLDFGDQTFKFKPTQQEIQFQEFNRGDTLPPEVRKIGNQLKKWHQTTGEYGTTVVDIVDEEGNPTGESVLISTGEKTKTQRFFEDIKQTPAYQATFFTGDLSVRQISEAASRGVELIKKAREGAIDVLSYPRRKLGVTDEMIEPFIGVGIPEGYWSFLPEEQRPRTGLTFKEIQDFSPGVIKPFVPTTPEEFLVDFGLWYGGTKTVQALGLKPSVIAQVAFADPLTGLFESGYSSAYQPTTGVGKFTKGAIGGFVAQKFIPTAYMTKIGKDLFKDPLGTIYGFTEYATQEPAETAGFLFGAGLIEKGLMKAEKGIRKLAKQPEFKVNTVNVPGYGEIKVVESAKYGKLKWIEGVFSESEKVNIMNQLQRAGRKGRYVFVQSSPSGIKLTKLPTGTYGFEVISATKPLRGFYENPPMKFLNKFKKDLGEPEVLTHYLELTGQRRGLRSPQDIVNILTGDATFGKRPSVQLRRAQYPKTPRWIYQIADALDNNKKIPKASMKNINKWYNKFLKEPIEWNGQTYVGKAKLDLINQMNIKGQASGLKLKTYAALLQYSLDTRTPLIGGAEIIAGVSPWGPESQLISPPGTRFYRKSLKDLRRAKDVTPMEKITNFLTQTQRGQGFAEIGGQLIEFDFFRAYGGKPKPTGGKTPAQVLGETLIGSTSRRRTPTRLRPPSILPTTLITVERERPRTERQRTRERTRPRDTRFTLTAREQRTRERPREARGRFTLTPRRERPRDTRFTLTPRRERPRDDRPRTRPRDDRPRPRKTRPRPRLTFKEIVPWLYRPKKKGKKKKKIKQIRKGRLFALRPTAFQLAAGIDLTGKKALPDITGFEVLR
jgi:hypothetical protein